MNFRHSLLILALLPVSASLAQSIGSLNSQQKEIAHKKDQLKRELKSIQKEIDKRESGERDILSKLKKSEQSISEINARISRLESQKKQTEKALKTLRGQSDAQKKALDETREDLSRQLYTQYTNGLSPWAALLNGKDAQQTGRELGYLGYISKQRSKSVKKYRQKIAEYQATEKKITAKQSSIKKLKAQTEDSKASLAKAHKQYQSDLTQVRDDLQKRRRQASAISRDQQNLDNLTAQISQKIAAQKEAMRQAEVARQKAAAQKEREAQQRQAEQKRVAAEQARIASEKQAHADELRRQAQQMRQQAEAARKQNRQDMQDAQRQLGLAISPDQEEQVKKRIQEAFDQDRKAQEQIRTAARQAEEAEIERAKARQAQEKAREAAALQEKAQEDTRKAQSQASSSGLQKGAPWPLRGQVLSRFATTRPDTGGVWRGILIQASRGASVKAVAGGSVVYAGWLNGFGNLMIIDHGNDYMSVYGYNDSLLKSVGDSVKTGDVVAKAGSSGGQVEPALYFEIRKSAKPIDPLSMLSR